jgi:sugar phosphate isomerase/epimerase
MQGRLLPKYLGQYQAHPVGFWQDEFPLAAGLGLDCIEFILDFETAEVNPLLSPSGRESIVRVIHESGVQVLSICADYFMQSPLHLEDHSEAKKSAEVLTHLIEICPEIGIRNIVIPCVDRSSLRDLKQQDLLVESLSKFLDRARSNNVQLALETDLAPQDFLHLLQKIGDSAISVNYDMGNSASLGFDPVTEFGAYGERISDVHVKDRPFRGSSTTLGEGDAQITLVLQLLDGLSYQGPLIMQAFRDDDGYATFGPQYETLLSYLRLTK